MSLPSRFTEEERQVLRMVGAIPVSDLRAKLAKMKLVDDTGDPVDRGYMAAWEEISEWLDDGCMSDKRATDGDERVEWIPRRDA